MISLKIILSFKGYNDCIELTVNEEEAIELLKKITECFEAYLTVNFKKEKSKYELFFL